VALPVIMAGIRSSAVAIMATTPLMSLIGADTLGDDIIAGLNLNDTVRVFAAAVLVVVMALATEALFAWLERRATSPVLRASEAAAGGPFSAEPAGAPG
jgi:osmoprotectant transport system permease protein